MQPREQRISWGEQEQTFPALWSARAASFPVLPEDYSYAVEHEWIVDSTISW